MAGFWIVRGSDIKDQDALKQYGEMWSSIAARYSARIIGGKGEFKTMEGPEFPRVLIIEFPSYQMALDCYNDPEYVEAMKYAHQAYDRELVVVAGVD